MTIPSLFTGFPTGLAVSSKGAARKVPDPEGAPNSLKDQREEGRVGGQGAGWSHAKAGCVVVQLEREGSVCF